MYTNKLVQQLKSLDRKEMTRFYEFICSPYFNKHLEVSALCGYFNRVYPKFSLKNCNRHTIFKKLFPNKKHDQAHLALLFTYCFKLFEQFLIQEEFKQENVFQRVLLLRKLRGKEQFKYYEKNLDHTAALINKIPYRDISFYNYQYLLSKEADDYYAQLNRLEKNDSIQYLQDNLNYFFIAEKLNKACEMRGRTKILKIDYSTEFTDIVVQEVGNNLEKYQSFPAIIVYYHVYQMLGQEDHAHYYQLLSVLETNEAYFSRQELYFIYTYPQNYCIEYINRNEKEFLQALFLLYKKLLEKDLLVEGAYITEGRYKNIVTTAIRKKELDWVKNFIELYKERLHPEVRETAYSFNLASYYYSSGAYDQVLELLLRVDYIDIRYSLGAKALLLRTYYDLEETEALLSLEKSFKQYINRNKLIPETRKQAFLHLIKYTKRAIVLKSRLAYTSRTQSIRDLEKLELEIKKTDHIINEDWILSKIEAIRSTL